MKVFMQVDFTSLALHGSMAFIGGIVRAIKKKKSRVVEYITFGLVSSFSGVIFALIFKHFYPNYEYLHLAVAGIGGWAGSDGIEFIYKLLKKFLEDSIRLLK